MIIADESISLLGLFIGIQLTCFFTMGEWRSNALVGALRQSFTFITGIKALLLIVAGFYLLSLLTGPVLSRQAAAVTE